MENKENKKINASEIKATEINPTDIKPTNIEPTNIQSTNIEPTDIKYNDIKDTKVFPNNKKPKEEVVEKYSKKMSFVKFFLFVGISLFTCIFWILKGWQTYILTGVFLSVFMLIMFIIEINNMTITQEDVDEWNKKHHESFHLKIEETNKLANKFSFWLNKISKPFMKVIISVSFIGTITLWVAASTIHFSGAGVGSSVAGNTYVDSPYTITFNENNTYVQKYSGATMDSGSWSQSGNKVTCHSNGGITIVFTVGSSYISSDGIRWQKK